MGRILLPGVTINESNGTKVNIDLIDRKAITGAIRDHPPSRSYPDATPALLRRAANPVCATEASGRFHLANRLASSLAAPGTPAGN